MILAILTALLVGAHAIPEPNIRNLRARFHPETNSIFIEWEFSRPTDNVQFKLRYRMAEQTSEQDWKIVNARDTLVRLNMPGLKHGDEIHVQVSAERGGHVIEDWSQVLVITVTKKVTIGDVEVDGAQLIPPVDFQAHITDPHTIRLQWTPVEQEIDVSSGLFYIVTVKQLTTKSGGALQRQQIKTAANSFTMSRLVSGEKYELTIRTATPAGKVSSTGAIVEITMPTADEYFEIGNLIVSSQFSADGMGTVNLTWDVPPHIQQKIKGHDVQIMRANESKWRTINFDGPQSTATLHDLESNTEYVLKIKTILRTDVELLSSNFNFRTPKVEIDPIRKVDVIYSHDFNSVRLQWVLQQHINVATVAGYDVYFTENKELPEREWRFIPLRNKEAALSLPNLHSLTTYYVKINVRHLDGTVTKMPGYYRFKTITDENNAREAKEANSLSYRNLVPGKVSVSWTYSRNVMDEAIGSVVFYSDNKNIPLEQWYRTVIHDPRNNSIILTNLREGTRYFVQIIPRLRNGDLDHERKESFEMHTDTRERFEEQMRRNHPAIAAQLQSLQLHGGKEFMRIISCNPDAIKTECAWDETCISQMQNNGKGWCIPYSLRDAVLHST